MKMKYNIFYFHFIFILKQGNGKHNEAVCKGNGNVHKDARVGAISTGHSDKFVFGLRRFLVDNFCIFHISTSGPRVAVITVETVTSVDQVPGLELGFIFLVIVVVKISFFELISFYGRLNFSTSVGFIATAGQREGLLQPARHHAHQVLLQLVNV